VVALSGVGLDLLTQPAALDFGNVQLGSSKTLAWTLTNASSVPTDAIAIQPSAGPQASAFGWSISQGVVAPGGTLTVQVTFSPAAIGLAKAWLPFRPCPTCAVVQVPLSGTGVSGALSLAPSPVDFGATLVGQSTVLAVTATNFGSGPVSLVSLVVDGGTDFSLLGLPGAFPVTVQPAASVTFQAAFRPSSPGSENAELIAAYQVPGQSALTAVDALSGAGALLPCSLVVNPSAVSFGTVTLGQSAQRGLSLTNDGGASCVLSHFGFDAGTSPGFALANPGLTQLTIDAGLTAVLSLVDAPTSAVPATQTGTLTFQATDPGLPSVSVPLSATVVLPPCQLSVHPPSLNFGVMALGATAQLSASITNTGAQSCSLTQLGLGNGSDPGFTLVGASSSLSILPGQSASVTVQCHLAASASSFRQGRVIFGTNDPSWPNGVLPLSAFSTGPPGPYAPGWPKLFFDNDNSSRTSADTSTVTGRVLWTFAMPPPPPSAQLNPTPTFAVSPIVGPDGTIYQLDLTGALRALDASGAVRWTTPLQSPAGDPFGATPFLAADGTLYVTSGSDPTTATPTLYRVASANGAVLTTALASAAGADGFDIAPLLGNDGYLFAFDDYSGVMVYQPATLGLLQVLSAGGSERNAFVLASDSSSYWSFGGAQVVALTPPAPPSGGLRQSWQWLSSQVPALASKFAYTGNLSRDSQSTGNLLLAGGFVLLTSPPSGGTAVAALRPSDGGTVWTSVLPAGTLASSVSSNANFQTDVGNSGAAIGRDGTAYVGNVDGLYALSPLTGATLPGWPFASAAVTDTPSVGGDGALFFGTIDGTFYGVNSDGGLRFKVATGGRITSSPAIGPDGTVYFVSDDGNLYAVH